MARKQLNKKQRQQKALARLRLKLAIYHTDQNDYKVKHTLNDIHRLEAKGIQ